MPESSPTTPAPPPVARIYASTTTGDAPLRVQFVDDSSGYIGSRIWSFGDGYRSESSDPSHRFEKAGTYTVRLTVSGAGGSDTDSIVINVHDATAVAGEEPAVSAPESGDAGITEAESGSIAEPGGLDFGAEAADSTAAAVAAVAGAAAAVGVAASAGSLGGAGRIPPPGSPPDPTRELADEYQNLLDQIATMKANRAAYDAEGIEYGKDGMLTVLEKEAIRRKAELEAQGVSVDYEGKVTGQVGPEAEEKAMHGLEHKLDSLSDWVDSSQADLDRTEEIFQKWQEVQNLSRRAEQDSVKWTDGLVEGLKGTADDLTTGVLLMGYPQAIADALIESQPQTLTEFYSAVLVGIGRNTGELINPVNLLPIHELKTFYKWYEGELDLSWDQVAGLGGSAMLKTCGCVHIGKGISSHITKTLSSPKPSVSKVLDIELLKKSEANYYKSSSPEALEAVSKTIKSGPDGMVVSIGEARKNPALLDAINKDPNLRNPLMEFDANCHTGGKTELAKFVAKEENVAADSIYVHDYTGHKGVTKLPHDHDATAYRYIPEGNEPAPHTSSGFDSTKFEPKGQLTGDGKHYYDFKEQTVKPIESGQYYESSASLSQQQTAYNQGYTNAAGTKLKPEYVGEITESNVTSHAHPEAYIEGDFSPKQYKIDNPLSHAAENLEQASLGNAKAGKQAVADVHRAVYETSKTIRKANEHGVLQKLPEGTRNYVEGVQKILTSEKPVTVIMDDLRSVGTSIEGVGQMLKNLGL